MALLGSSGCGKTTLLCAIAGFAQPSAGSISVAGRDVTRLPPDRRGMALVFQSYALWPHMTVTQNIGYGLKLRRLPRAEIARRFGELEELLGLSGLGQRKPTALSGGQRQRVALGRALAIDPQILLRDEPLSNLDARIRLKVRHDISALQKRLCITAVHVTHDREEAMVTADRIVIMDAGRIAQQGTPEDVYNRPASPFFAAFMGAENALHLSGNVGGGYVTIETGPDSGRAVLPLEGRALESGRFEARFRAEAAKLIAEDPHAASSGAGLELSGLVETASYPGGAWRHSVRVGQDELLVDSPRPFERGAAVRVRIPGEKLFLFNARSAPKRSRTRFPHDGSKDRVLETAAFAAVDAELEQAARSVGAGALRTFRDVTLPLAAPGLLASAIFVFLESLDEFTGSYFVGAPDVNMLPLLLYTTGAGGNYQVASITALLLLIPSIGFMLVVERFLKSDVLSKVGH